VLWLSSIGSPLDDPHRVLPLRTSQTLYPDHAAAGRPTCEQILSAATSSAVSVARSAGLASAAGKQASEVSRGQFNPLVALFASSMADVGEEVTGASCCMVRAFVEREPREGADRLAESARGRRGMASIAPDAGSGREVVFLAGRHRNCCAAVPERCGGPTGLSTPFPTIYGKVQPDRRGSNQCRRVARLVVDRRSAFAPLWANADTTFPASGNVPLADAPVTTGMQRNHVDQR
jgi:hypothetical protein